MTIQKRALSRKEREFLQQRSEIIEVARALFSKKGFHRVTMRQIAQKAEFSVGKLYKFFSNKAALYRFLLEEVAEAFERELTAALRTEGDAVRVLRACVNARIQVWEENIDAIRVYLTETQGSRFGPHATLESRFKAQYEKSLRRVAEVFQRGIDQGLFRQGSPYLYTLILDGITQNLLLARMENPSVAEVGVDQVFDILIRGIGKPEGV